MRSRAEKAMSWSWSEESKGLFYFTQTKISKFILKFKRYSQPNRLFMNYLLDYNR